ncbi:MAG: TonB-dependent receptor [Gammaproteobacteria bacterium]|nr:TonB-dependent receptor [Gammaproteobacteria bacterium]MCY4200678.1 TonB-dependent receptor [Gammaproteobacteria bacterium]MCY4278428.1 TonB-dependent receptor [Gammaproteobacteria bacterium]MCY4322693.1 TonB-dependent receptor [Gammaproteobacteria bacterium]
MRSIGVTQGWVLFACSMLWGALLFAPDIALAQEEAEDEEDIASQDVSAESEAAAGEDTRQIEEVVVTGSRLRRDTFSSISPLQIITGEISRESGLLDAADILQESTSASGQQVNLTFQGFVLDDGPGSSTVNLRGLEASRTLVLINGRRVAPAGVEGAPTNPNLNLVPASLVQQYDILLDGASSIYGSDAVAGVVNAILRKDFDGFEFETYSNIPQHGAGQNHTLNLTWGRNWDRGFVGAAIEYRDVEAVEMADRPWTKDCDRNAEIDENGRVRTQDLRYSTNFNMPFDDCALGSLAGRIVVPGAGSIYYTPGRSNGGWPNFSEANSRFGTFGVDGDGDGLTDVNFRDYDINGRDRFAHIGPDYDRTSLFAYGEYTFEGEMNLTPYFEFLWGRQDFFSNSGSGQLFPWVPAGNPFNPCNPDAEGGVDCGLAEAELLTNPNYVKSFSEYYTNLNGCFGLSPEACSPAAFGVVPGALGAQRVRPIVSVTGDRNLISTEVTQSRFVGGLSGDLPFLNVGTFGDWSFDVAIMFSSSEGDSSRPGVRNDRLNLAIGTYSTTSTPCENDTGAPLAADVAPGCVPVNMFAPSLYPPEVIGDFATQAERDYVFDTRDFETEYEQTIFTFFMSGDVFELPAGNVIAGLGIEWRKDEINSVPDAVAGEGLFFGFFADGGAAGDKVTKELFAEVEVPVFAGLPLAEELTLNLSARLTDDEYYGEAWTEAFKLGYRPFSSLLLRATRGTSYRAPNLRELFLRGQTGFQNLVDPCFIPELAYDQLNNTHVPENDLREEFVLENCRREGVDPTIAWNGGFNTFSTEVSAGGTQSLDEETSTSKTLGFSWEQPFTNRFQLGVAANLYEIEIRNEIIEPSAQFIINDCFFTETGESPYCARIARDLSDPVIPRLSIIDQAFINRDLQRVEGVDVNMFFEDTLTIFERPWLLRIDFNAHRLLERSTKELDEDGNLDFSEFQGEWYFPAWNFQVGLSLEYDRWDFGWRIDYLDGVKSDAAFQDDWDDVSGESNTCLGPPDDVLCRDIEWTSDYYLHNVSLYWRGDRLTIGGGARNLLDQSPPFVNEGPAVASNVPLGAGYDIDGRMFFFNVQLNFGGGE